jgi:Ca2+-binding RTX toxin-like protein
LPAGGIVKTSLAMLRAASCAIPIAAVLIAAPAASAQTGSCDGIPAPVRGGKVIRGGPGDDVLLGSSRSQTILGGGGNDHICAGDGNDVIHGGPGDDVIHGDGRGDTVYGDGGSDRLYGDLLDDRLYGGRGADLLIGGHGVDVMFGGPGADLLRGGTNIDCFYGDGGVNTASFATATPPGVPRLGIDGVRVDLHQPARGRCPRRGSGRADGDANGVEVLDRIQFVIGSAFADSISGPGAGVDGGLGSDSCSGFPQPTTHGCGAGDEKPPGTFAYVLEPASPGPPDPGLIVRAADGVPSESISLSPSVDRVRVGASGDALATGSGCDPSGSCAPSAGRLGYVLVYGADGADRIDIADGLDPDSTVDADGGPGDDVLNGSSSGEVLLGGDFPGADTLNGNGGDDALISEGGNPTAGPDVLSGGPGDDQLVSDYPCAGDSLSGGPGDDIAGFARSKVGVSAVLGGTATLRTGRCPGGPPSTIAADSEVLEGTEEADRLVGSPNSDTIWGRGGADVIVGRGGADILEGFGGRDFINARDHQRDLRIDCGSARDRRPRTDRIDPRPVKC